MIVVPWNKVYYLDSLIRQPGYPDRDFRKTREVIDDAFIILKSKGGATRCKKGTNKLSHPFKFPCRQQPKSSATCGFYACAHMDELVHHQNLHWQEKDFSKLFTDMATEDYDWRKDFAHIRETFAYFLNNDVLRPSGEFYDGLQVPPKPTAQ